MATARPLTGVIFVLVCGSVIQSGFLQPLSPSAPAFKPFKDSFASQRVQGVAAGVSASSRKCSVIRRMTSYERTNVPFLCAPSGQMVPLPAQMDPEKAQVLNAMRSGGWSMCYKSVPMPVQKFQRIPVCCPGTMPTRNGGCIYPQPAIGENPREPLNPQMQGSASIPPMMKQTPRAFRKLLQGRRPNKMLPSHLLQQMITSRGRPPPPPGMMVPTPPYASLPGPLGVASPDWQDEMARYLISVMYHQLLAERRQQLLQEEIERQLRVMMMAQQRRVAYQKMRQMILNHTPSSKDLSATSSDPAVAIPSLKLDATTLAPEVERTSMDSVNVDNAPQMAILQQDTTPTSNGLDTLLKGGKEQGSQWNGSGPGILDSNPDLRVPQETTPAGPLFVDGTSPNQGMSETNSDLLQNTSGISGPAGNEEITVVNGVPGNLEGTPGGMGGMPGGMGGMPGGMGGMPGGMGGMPGGMGGMPGGMGGMPGGMGGMPGGMGGMPGGMGGMPGGMGGMPGGMGGMPGGMGGMPGGMGAMPGGPHHGGPPQLPPGVTQEMLVQTRDKVKAMVEACLKQSSISNSMETIVQSGDVALLRPVCLASDMVGPCIMSKAKENFAEDNNLNMIGRQMVQGALMSLGGLCMQLQKSGQLEGTAPGNGSPNEAAAVTTPPVFPNPAPSMSSAGVTDSVEEKFAPTQGSALGATPSAKSSNPSQQSNTPKAAVDDAAAKQHYEASPKAPLPGHGHGHGHGQGQGHASASASAHTHEAQEVLPGRVETAAASFPMWMILVMVGAAAALLLITCLVVCLVVRCRRRKKKVELEREPEKLPIPAVVPNIYAASPCLPPPAYSTTPVKQTLGGEEDLEKDFKIPEDTVEEKKEEIN